MRTSARPRSASNAECGLSHQRSRPITGGTGKAAQSSAHQRRVAQVTACAATAACPAGGSPATQRSSWETHGLPSPTHARDSASRVRTASTGERAPPSASRRTAARPSARRAVRADQANGSGSPVPANLASPSAPPTARPSESPSATRTS